MPVLCTDGRRGIVTAPRDSALSGDGKVRLSDGTEADFIFGEAAHAAVIGEALVFRLAVPAVALALALASGPAGAETSIALHCVPAGQPSPAERSGSDYVC